MNRSEAFREVARSARRIAELADAQKDTVGWWTEYAQEFQKLNDAFAAAPPKKDTHIKSANRAMQEIQDNDNGGNS